MMKQEVEKYCSIHPTHSVKLHFSSVVEMIERPGRFITSETCLGLMWNREDREREQRAQHQVEEPKLRRVALGSLVTSSTARGR